MMSSLFMIFDPTSSMILLSNWLGLLTIIMLPSAYWLSSTKINFFITNVTTFINNELKLSLQTKKMNLLILMSFFMMLVLNNTMSLFPYIFNTTSHLSITLSLSFPIWVGSMMFGIYNYIYLMLAHLVPTGTPEGLMPIMVMIESISTLIRPLTLAVRLAANMIAGHLLMCLLGNQFNMTSYATLGLLTLIQIMLSILEISVSLIQSYVFTLLMTLYISEIN